MPVRAVWGSPNSGPRDERFARPHALRRLPSSDLPRWLARASLIQSRSCLTLSRWQESRGNRNYKAHFLKMLVYLRTTSPHRRTISPNRDDWALTLGLEAPDITIDKTGDPDADKRARAPDGGFNVRWTPGDRGHVQFSSIF
jgi:hypothetical protein